MKKEFPARGVAALEIPGLSEPMPVYLKFNAPALSLWYASAEGYTYDPAGRPFAAQFDERRFRRALDGKIIETKWAQGRPRHRVRYVRVLEGEEKQAVLQRWRERILPVYEAVQHSNVRVLPFSHPAAIQPDLQTIEQLIEKMLKWDAAALEEDVAAYHRVYRPVTILPPDQYLSLYIQMTIGCSYNRCVFCDFYRDRPYFIPSIEAFEQHLDAVEHYFGEALSLRRTLFLGDANALHIKREDLLQRFSILHQRFQIGQKAQDTRPYFSGIYSFIDSFTGVHLPVSLLQELRAGGLRRVYIGFETAHEPLRRFLQKPGSTQEVMEVIRNLKAAGIQVGVIFLIGVGGKAFAAAHLHDSVNALKALHLDDKDIIYLSDLVVQPDTEYRQVATNAGWDILDAQELLQERLRWMQAIKAVPSLAKAKIASYDIREFIY